MGKENISFEQFKSEVLSDYKLGWLSRNISLIGRKEVLTGKAKFGIFGDGKEVVQLAMAKYFEKGDWRSGYYRDQTMMMALGIFSTEEFFAQLYGDTNIEFNPSNGGRSFNNHFGTRSLNEDGSWKNLTERYNTSADISPTAGQMPRLLGLAWASKLYKNNPELHQFSQFSKQGNEVAWGTIGDASTSEGHFWETLNAANVLEVPLAMVVYDDGYGISVPKKFQTTKQSISEALAGFKRDENGGMYIYKAKAWNYPELIKTFKEGIQKCREEHVPVLFHIEEVTQPQGHSTSGSHERYKSEERLKFESDFDGLRKMKEWILQDNIASEEELTQLEKEAANDAKEAKKIAWKRYIDPIKSEQERLLKIVATRGCRCVVAKDNDKVDELANELKNILVPSRKDIFSTAKKILRNVCSGCQSKHILQGELKQWLKDNYEVADPRYHQHLYVEDETSALKVKSIPAEFEDSAPTIAGREILRDNFHAMFAKNPRIITFGEDTGKIGGVNQSMEGMQLKYGDLRVSDTGIRETTILGQGIGTALRGLRPIVEIQYFDYLLYALQTLSDDLATTHYRTAGGQKAPVVIRTRGHRLEGIWHSGSPLSMVINSIRGVYVCVPRNMTQAAGFYNTLMASEDSALVIEPLNGYRLHERKPTNIGEFNVPLGVPEILQEGKDITLVTYGSCVKIAQDAIPQLAEFGISVELIDVQTLLPFDINKTISESIKKTNRVLFFDEDVPGGATAFMMQKVIEEQNAYQYLDSAPRTLSAEEHRPAYGTDGDYFSNPNAENVFEAVYEIMHESNPKKYPLLF
ncbi:MAG: hypothetical protein JXR60_10570 [Bacteroidales bacterium]|nr:hypothetical protein [Bacteroidales bacterium]